MRTGYAGSSRLALCLGALFICCQAAAAPWDEVFTLEGITGQFRAFDQDQNRFVFMSGNRVMMYDLAGNEVESLRGLGENISTNGAFQIGIHVVDEDSLVSLGTIEGDLKLITWEKDLDQFDQLYWRLDTQSDVDIPGNPQTFAAANDGTYWVTNDGSQLIQVGSSGAVLQTISIPIPILGLPGQSDYIFGSFFFHQVAIEPSTGRFVMYATGNFPISSQPARLGRYAAHYYFEGPNLVTLSRRRQETHAPDRMAAGPGVLYVHDHSERKIIGYQLEEASPPEFNDITLNPEGTIWRFCENNGRRTFDAHPDAHFDVTWNGGAGALGQIREGIGFTGDLSDSDKFTLRYDFWGSPLDDMPNPGIELELVNSHGESSGVYPYQSNVSRFSGPGFISTAVLWDAGCNFYSYTKETDPLTGSGSAKWGLSYRWPPVSLDATVIVDDWVPFIGGKTFGLKDMSADFQASMVSKGEGSVTLTGGATFKAGDGSIGFRMGGGAITKLEPTQLTFDGGLASFNMTGSISDDMPFLEAFPVFLAVTQIPFIGRLAKLIADRAKAVATISASLDAKATFRVDPEGTLMENLCFQSAIGMGFGAKIGVIVDFFRGLAEFSAYGGANTGLAFASVPDDCTLWEFKDFAVRFLLGYRFVLFGATATDETVYVFKHPTATKAGAKPLRKSSGQKWRYTYGSLDGKKRVADPFVINANPFAVARTKGATDPSVETPIIGGVGQDARPQSGLAPDGTMMLVWIQERADLPPSQATDIYFSYFNSFAFTPPAPIALDTQADFNPVVAYHNSGVWVALWSRVRNPNLPTTGDPAVDATEQSKQLDPVYAVFDPAIGSWTPVTVIELFAFPGNYTSTHTRLATGLNNELVGVWLTGENEYMIPVDIDDSSQDTINYVYASLFNNGVFEKAGYVGRNGRTDIASAASRTIDLYATFNNEELVIASQGYGGANVKRCAMERNNEFAFFRCARGPSRTAYDGYTVLAMRDGTYRTLWTDKNRIKMVREPFAGDPAIINGTVPDTIYEDTRGALDSLGRAGLNLEAFHVGETQNGEVFIVMPSHSSVTGEPNLRLMVDNQGLVSGAGELMSDSSSEKSPSVTLGSDGKIRVVYFKANVTQTQIEVDLEDGDGPQPFTRYTEAAIGQIAMTSYQVHDDLSLNSINMLTPALTEGSVAEISVVVENSGDFGIMDPKVSVFVRDLSAGAKGPPDDYVVAENVVAFEGTMPPHSSAELQFEWVLPADSEYQAYAVVDPNDEISEFTESNNGGSASPNQGDLIFSSQFEALTE